MSAFVKCAIIVRQTWCVSAFYMFDQYFVTICLINILVQLGIGEHYVNENLRPRFSYFYIKIKLNVAKIQENCDLKLHFSW